MAHQKKIVWLFLIVSGFNISAFVVPETVEEKELQILFKIERSRDPDEIWYATNLNQNDSLIRDMPVIAFWVKKTENNKIEPLTRIQKRYGYGIKAVEPGDASDNEWHFQIAAYTNRIFKLKKASANQYKVFTHSGNKEIALTRIFVEFDGGSFLIPSVSHVRLTGVDLKTGREITETIDSGK